MSFHTPIQASFIDAFAQECRSKGLTEKQAAELLNNYLQKDFYNNNADYREGFDSVIKEVANID